MTTAARHRPTKPIDAFPVAELPPLPPAGAPGEMVEGQADPAPAAKTPVEVAVLRFLDPAALSVTIALRHPFELDGREVREIVVRRLSVAEVGTVMLGFADDDGLDPYAFFSAMTGFPAPVLRGLIDDDGMEVVGAARPLLPRYVRTTVFPEEPDSPTPATGCERGGGSPSPRHEP